LSRLTPALLDLSVKLRLFFIYKNVIINIIDTLTQGTVKRRRTRRRLRLPHGGGKADNEHYKSPRTFSAGTMKTVKIG